MAENSGMSLSQLFLGGGGGGGGGGWFLINLKLPITWIPYFICIFNWEMIYVDCDGLIINNQGCIYKAE